MLVRLTLSLIGSVDGIGNATYEVSNVLSSVLPLDSSPLSCLRVVGLLTGLNEVERELTQERTLQSVEYRRKTGGNLGGRPKTSSKKEKLVLRLREEGDSLRSIQEQTGVAVKTIRRIIADNEKVAVGIK